MNKCVCAFASIMLSCAAIFASSCGASPSTSSQTTITTTEPIKEGKRIYLAAPLFSQADRDYNLVVTQVLEEHDYQVFLPQRDGYLAPDLAGLTEEQKITKIFDKDYEEVMKADIFFGIFDGRVPDEGVCIELGIAYANNKRCYGFKTDARTIEYDMNLNPMIAGCLSKLFYDMDGDAALKSLSDYLSTNQL